MKKIFILGTLLCAATAHADMPTLQYVYDFYNRECGMPVEMGFVEFMQGELDNMAGHPVSTNSIVSEFIPMFAVDAINGGTTYSEQLTTNNIVSVGYLKSTLNLINSPICCKNGLQFDPDSFSCIGTITCPDGTVVDDILNMCLAPDDIYDDAYTGTMTSGYACSPYAYVREETACPAGWERVELSHAGWAETIPANMSRYSEYNGCDIDIIKSSESYAQIDVCLPPVANGEIATTSGSGSNDWAIGENCTVTGNVITCDTTYVNGWGVCGSWDGKEYTCDCSVGGIMSPDGTLYDARSAGVDIKLYSNSASCTSNCAADCANAVKTMPGFRHALMATYFVGCAE